MDPKEPSKPPTSNETTSCTECGRPIKAIPEYPNICDTCYSEKGSCCNEQTMDG